MNIKQCGAKDPKTCRYHGNPQMRGGINSYLTKLKEVIKVKGERTYKSPSGHEFRVPETYKHDDTVLSKLSPYQISAEVNFDERLRKQEFEASLNNRNDLKEVFEGLNSQHGEEIDRKAEKERTEGGYVELSPEAQRLRDALDSRIKMEDYFGSERNRSTSYMGQSFSTEEEYREWINLRSNNEGQYQPNTFIQTSPYSYDAFQESDKGGDFEVVFEMSAANGLRATTESGRKVVLSRFAKFDVISEQPLTIKDKNGQIRKVLLVQLDEQVSEHRAKNTREYNNF